MTYVPDMAARRAELTPERAAFRDVPTGRVWTFAEVNDAADRLAHAFAGLGIAKGGRVGILCLNRPEFFVVLFACLKAETVLVPLNWRQPLAELAPVAERARLAALFHDVEFAEVADAIARDAEIPAVAIDAEASVDYALEALLAQAPAGPAGTGRRRAADIWYLLHTSGTTGQPKAVMQTFAMAWANAVNIGQAIDLTSADVSLNFLPLFHTGGINLYTLPLFLAGGTSFVTRKFDPAATLELIATGALTCFFGVPTVYQELSGHPAFARADLARVRSWGSGGAPLPEALIHLYAGRGALICQGMGMTETGPTVFLMDRDHVLEKPGSVGKAQILTEIRIVGADGAPVDAGEPGELQVRGPNVTPGYFENEAATGEAFAPGGWLKTGDVARRDADGYVFIVDRIKDMLISGGENVYPGEVEAVLATHPDILEAAVIGVADAKWGEVGIAFLLPRPGRSIDTEALKPWCRERLAAYKVPKRFAVVAEFPRTAAGKVRKNVLREIADA